MKKKKAIELTMKTIAILVLILVFLIFAVAFYLKEMQKGQENLKVDKKYDINKMVDDVIDEAKNS